MGMWPRRRKPTEPARDQWLPAALADNPPFNLTRGIFAVVKGQPDEGSRLINEVFDAASSLPLDESAEWFASIVDTLMVTAASLGRRTADNPMLPVPHVARDEVVGSRLYRDAYDEKLPEFDYLAMAVGVQLTGCGDLDGAQAAFAQATKENDPAAKVLLGLSCAYRNDIDTARDWLHRGLADDFRRRSAHPSLPLTADDVSTAVWITAICRAWAVLDMLPDFPAEHIRAAVWTPMNEMSGVLSATLANHSFTRARMIAQAVLDAMDSPDEPLRLFADEDVHDLGWAWVFGYTTLRFLETGDRDAAPPPGGGPIVVVKDTGDAWMLRAVESYDQQLHAYAAAHGYEHTQRYP